MSEREKERKDEIEIGSGVVGVEMGKLVGEKHVQIALQRERREKEIEIPSKALSKSRRAPLHRVWGFGG